MVAVRWWSLEDDTVQRTVAVTSALLLLTIGFTHFHAASVSMPAGVLALLCVLVLFPPELFGLSPPAYPPQPFGYTPEQVKDIAPHGAKPPGEDDDDANSGPSILPTRRRRLVNPTATPAIITLLIVAVSSVFSDLLSYTVTIPVGVLVVGMALILLPTGDLIYVLGSFARRLREQQRGR